MSCVYRFNYTLDTGGVPDLLFDQYLRIAFIIGDMMLTFRYRIIVASIIIKMIEIAIEK